MHIRQQIREEAVTLASGLTTTGSNVYNEQLFPLEQEELPAWVVFTRNEDVESDSMGGGQMRQLEVLFSGNARGTNGRNLKNTLDTMLEELEEVALKTAFTNVSAFELINVEYEPDVEETDAAMGELVVTYRATYFTNQGSPSA